MGLISTETLLKLIFCFVSERIEWDSDESESVNGSAPEAGGASTAPQRPPESGERRQDCEQDTGATSSGQNQQQ